MNVSSRVGMMAGDVAQGICGMSHQNGILVTGGSGECCWGGIGMLMECEIDIANRSENIAWQRVLSANNFIPESTELMLQFG